MRSVVPPVMCLSRPSRSDGSYFLRTNLDLRAQPWASPLTSCSSLLATSPELLPWAQLYLNNFSMTSDQPGQGGGGMSRAAKKRAKKNKKKLDKRPLDDAGSDALPAKKSKLPSDEPPSDEEVEKMSPAAPVVLMESSDSYAPSLPNTPLTEILMMEQVEDESKKAIIATLSSGQRAACAFEAILDPISLSEFYKEYFEKKPLLVRAKANNKSRYKNLLSLKSIQEMTKNNEMYYARDVNVTKYKKGKDGVKRRVTLDKLPESSKEHETGVKVDPKELWKNYESGCTVRLLCPHKFADNIHALLSTLELELQCMVGANAYLTPPKSSQGFAPHYDDIEAFCLQLEGSKRWKVYETTLKLPRVSSEDFTPEDLDGKEPVMDITLEEGDLLYMPRGWIHQACTLKDDNEHSLHLTVSAMQQWAWVDLLDTIMPEALENATMDETSTSLREGLPRGFLDYMGAMYEEPSDEKLPESLKKVGEEEAAENEEIRLRRMLHEKFKSDAKKRIMKVANTALDMVDAACDLLAKRFMSDRQPVALTQTEKEQTSRHDEDLEVLPNTLCRLVRPGIARLVIEEDKAVVYHCGDNSREYRGAPLSPLEFEMDDGPAIEQLLTTIEPHWIFVNDLYHDTPEDKIAIAQALYDEGILAVKGVPDEPPETTTASSNATAE